MGTIMGFKVSNFENVGVDASEHSFKNLLAKKETNVLRDSFILISPEKDETETIKAGYTVVYPGCRTSGHSHKELLEIYHIVKGRGIMKVDDEEFDVKPGDTFLIPLGGAFHTTSNPYSEPLEYFWVVSPDGK
jgi:mannose-6-phosphate isomerase-like protein (cupin superfamily)